MYSKCYYSISVRLTVILTVEKQTSKCHLSKENICVLYCMMNTSLIPYLHCMHLWCITAPRLPKLIRRAVASFWSGSLRCITTDRHLVYFWWIIIIIVSLSSKTSATGFIFDYRRYTILSSIGTLNWVVMMIRFLTIMYYLEKKCIVECRLLLGI